MRRMYSKPQLLEAVEQEAEVNGLKAFENIVDKDGHDRFIGGEITFDDTVPEGITKTYAHWSLSGTHLLIVIAFDTGIDSYSTFKMCDINLPQWIKDKIYPLVSNYVIVRSDVGRADDFSTHNATSYLIKENNVVDYRIGLGTTTKAMHFRIAIDLLIDNE